MKLNVAAYYIFLITVCSCAIGMGSGYTDWDANSNGQLTQYEFVRGYQMSNYFFKWNKAKEIGARQFYNTIYRTIDRNRDSLLTCNEFQTQIEYFYRSRLSRKCTEWDDDGDNRLSSTEFEKHAKKTNLLALWDISRNKKISEREMAEGMFALCDFDKDGHVSIVEFNIWNANR